jgi:hypothetical protein
LGCVVYFLSLVEIALEIIIEMGRAPENGADLVDAAAVGA